MNSLGSQTRLSWAVLLTMPLALGCGDRSAKLAPPDRDGALTHLNISLRNDTDTLIAIPWSSKRPRLDVSISGESLESDSGCLPACGNGCHCNDCPSEIGTFIQLKPHTTYTFSWIPRRFVARGCGERDGCLCVQSWPLTVGRYEVTVLGFSNPKTGQPIQESENLVLGSTPSATSKICSASFSFELGGEETAFAKFVCAPPS